jgi:hypothetical protein
VSDDWPDGWYSDVARRQPSEGGGAGAQDPQRVAPDSRPSGSDAWAYELRNPITTTVPFGGFETTSVGSVVLWNTAAAKEFFSDLGHDRTLPKDLITGSSIEGTA